MLSYLNAIGIMLLGVSPMLIPIGVTVADALGKSRAKRRDVSDARPA